jgi:uncharacterized membrane protein YdjX (TVP38/TMEM64 family)
MIGLLILALIAILAATLPVRDYAVRFIEWAKGLGPWGSALIAVAYIPACLFFVPGSLLTLGAGWAFGIVWGSIAVSIGSLLGATAAFLAGRTLVRGLIEDRVTRNPRFAAIDRAVAEQGFKIVLLTRLSPVFPFNLLNYAYGLTRVSLKDYVLASWIGMLPGTALYVYIGSAAKSLADLAAGRVDGGPGRLIVFFVGLLATLAVTIYVTRIARRALDDAVEERPVADGSEHLDLPAAPCVSSPAESC